MIAGVLITLHGTTTFTGGGTIACASPAAHKDICAHLFNLSYPDITRESMEMTLKIKWMLPATDSPSLKHRFVSKMYLIMKLQTLKDIDLKACNKKIHANLQIYRDLTKQELYSGTQYNLQPTTNTITKQDTNYKHYCKHCWNAYASVHVLQYVTQWHLCAGKTSSSPSVHLWESCPLQVKAHVIKTSINYRQRWTIGVHELTGWQSKIHLYTKAISHSENCAYMAYGCKTLMRV